MTAPSPTPEPKRKRRVVLEKLWALKSLESGFISTQLYPTRFQARGALRFYGPTFKIVRVEIFEVKRG